MENKWFWVAMFLLGLQFAFHIINWVERRRFYREVKAMRSIYGIGPVVHSQTFGQVAEGIELERRKDAGTREKEFVPFKDRPHPE